MDCHETANDDVVEDYLLGRLDEESRDAFEAHYFQCESCFRRLDACLALRRGLTLAPAPDRVSRPRRRHPWFWPVAVAAAAGLAIVVLRVRTERTGSPATAASSPGLTSARGGGLEELGRFAAPRYAPPIWRGGTTQAQERLEAGLSLYAAGDFGGAVPALRDAARRAPESPAAGFYLGLCLLQTGDTDGGIASLESVVLLGDTPYLEAAHFYLAKGHLLKGDARAAETELRSAIALKGDLESQARDLVRRIDDATRAHGKS